jgi:hypothetical protein
MASVSAFFLVGSTHPFDGGLDPSFVVKLYEGDRAMWRATSLSDPDDVIEMDPKGSSPDEIFQTGCKLVNLLALNFGADTAGLVVFQDSSIAGPSSGAELGLSIKLLFTTKV